MPGHLVVVERAYRGTVEQQYAHVLWLVHGLHTQSPLTVLLRGPAAVYALAAADNGAAEVGGIPWGTGPDYQAAVGRLQDDGADVYVSAASLADLGVATVALLPGVRSLSDDQITTLVGECDRWWYL
jgi:hypothetical protein